MFYEKVEQYCKRFKCVFPALMLDGIPEDILIEMIDRALEIGKPISFQKIDKDYRDYAPLEREWQDFIDNRIKGR